MKTKPYLVLSPVRRDGKLHPIGARIDLDAAAAAELLDVGVIRGVEADGEADRLAILRDAIAGIPLDAEHYTSAGVPRTDALATASGLGDVGADERDAAWVAFQSRESGAG